jgi:hypothetical protein
MGDPTGEFKAKGKPRETLSETRFWLGVGGMVVGALVVSALFGLHEGVEPVSMLISCIATAIGALSGVGLFHAVSRRRDDHMILLGMAGFLGQLGCRPLPFFGALVISFFMVALTVFLVVMPLRFLGCLGMYRAAKPVPPRSDHSLYDVEIDSLPAVGASSASFRRV